MSKVEFASQPTRYLVVWLMSCCIVVVAVIGVFSFPVVMRVVCSPFAIFMVLYGVIGNVYGAFLLSKSVALVDASRYRVKRLVHARTFDLADVAGVEGYRNGWNASLDAVYTLRLVFRQSRAALYIDRRAEGFQELADELSAAGWTVAPAPRSRLRENLWALGRPTGWSLTVDASDVPAATPAGEVARRT